MVSTFIKKILITSELTTWKYDNKKLLLQLRKNKNSKSCDLAVPLLKLLIQKRLITLVIL
jgi:hypothetical protein